jgi:hypothetical protein
MTQEHKPTKELERLCRALVINGVPQARIAEQLEISEHTLRKHYRKVLDGGMEHALALVTNNQLRIAASGSGMASVVSAKYILSCKAGWREQSAIELDVHAGISGLVRLAQEMDLHDAAKNGHDREAPDYNPQLPPEALS